jgi:uncharacterized CHY-type Zn-finger protein
MTDNPAPEAPKEQTLLKSMRICHVCKTVLTTKAESDIGVHVRCVHEVNNRPKYAIPRPAYGTRERD